MQLLVTLAGSSHDIFPDRQIGVKNVRVGKRDMPQYVRFVRRMLEADKVQLIAGPIDAKAAFCAVAKGRIGAPEWTGTMCSMMALLLASDCLMRPLYIPSENNPADHQPWA